MPYVKFLATEFCYSGTQNYDRKSLLQQIYSSLCSSTNFQETDDLLRDFDEIAELMQENKYTRKKPGKNCNCFSVAHVSNIAPTFPISKILFKIFIQFQKVANTNIK